MCTIKSQRSPEQRRERLTGGGNQKSCPEDLDVEDEGQIPVGGLAGLLDPERV